MINVFVKRGFSYTWTPYLHDWGGAEDRQFDLHTYEDLADLHELRAGPIIFGDIERLTSSDRALAADVERVISTERPDIPILNSPTTTLRRYDLLSEWHSRGLNPFRAYRLTDTTTPDRFPVFLRYENDHAGAASEVLRNQAELDRAIVRLMIRGHDLRQIIIVEFVDTSGGGEYFVKYAAFVVGDTIIGRNAHTSTNWVVKGHGASTSPQALATGLAYVRDNPHVSVLHQRFEAGDVQYGRIDYSMIGGSVVAWEINTNPTIIWTKSEEPPEEGPQSNIFLSKFSAALGVIEGDILLDSPISLDDTDEKIRAASREEPLSNLPAALHFARKYRRSLKPAVRILDAASVPFEALILDRWKRNNAT